MILRIRRLTRKSLGVFNSLMRSAQGIVRLVLVIRSSTLLRLDRDKDIIVYPSLWGVPYFPGFYSRTLTRAITPYNHR